jgi:hypothetical protein
MASPENQSSASHSSGSSGAGAMQSAMSDVAHQATEQIRDHASRAAGQAQERAQAFLSEQKEVAAEHIDGVVKVLHETVDQLRQRSPGAVSDYAERAVDSLDSVAQALREQDLRALVGQVEDFARRQPVMFIAGSVAIGFAVARFLKSSSRSGNGGYGQGATPPHDSGHADDRSSSYRGAGTNRPGAANTEFGRHVATAQRSAQGGSAASSAEDTSPGGGQRPTGQESG